MHLSKQALSAINALPTPSKHRGSGGGKGLGSRCVPGSTNYEGSDYSVDDLEFMQAMDHYKKSRHRPYPGWQEVLSVLRALGYRKEDCVCHP